jgi:hypothetical protein
MKDGRCGVTSIKVAALCHDLAKFSILFTPPTWARALRRKAIEDLEIHVRIDCTDSFQAITSASAARLLVDRPRIFLIN